MKMFILRENCSLAYSLRAHLIHFLFDMRVITCAKMIDGAADQSYSSLFSNTLDKKFVQRIIIVHLET